jgi:hypothetical protein
MDLDIGPLFGIGLSTSPLAGATPAVETQPPPPPVEPSPSTTDAQPTPPPTDATTAPATTNVTAAPTGAVTQMQVDAAPPSRRWQKIGMGVGGGMMVLGVLLWAKANSIQDDIDAKPMPRSPADFKALSDLEKQGDGAAGGGNLFFIVGAGVAGVSAYYYCRAGRSHSTQTARIAPAAFPHGAGLTLSFGGAP